MNKPNAWLVALGLGLLLICGNAAAQGQPIGNGIYACDGAAQAGPCQPEGDDSSYSGGGYTDNDYAHAEPKWADRWGAYASDGQIDGIVAGQNGKHSAEVAAINECQARGGAACKVIATYYNQCFAIAASNRSSSWASAETEALALKNSMNDCNSKSGGCFKYYSGCSLPERIQ